MADGTELASCSEGAESGNRHTSPFSWLRPQGKLDREAAEPEGSGTSQFPEAEHLAARAWLSLFSALLGRVKPWHLLGATCQVRSRGSCVLLGASLLGSGAGLISW